MKLNPLLILISFLTSSIDALAQGTLLFNNKVPGITDFQFKPEGDLGFIPRGSFGAQLFLVPPPGQGDPFALFPATTFKTGPGVEDLGYINPVLVTVPGHGPGEVVTMYLTAFNGASFEDSDPECRAGGPTLFQVTLGTPTSPAYLPDLPDFNFMCANIPEPSTAAMLVLGLTALLVRAGMRGYGK